MKTGKQGITLIKQHEGFRERAYRCPAGIWTIGYGHTLGVKATDRITRDQAGRLLEQDIETAEKTVTALVKKPLRQQQFDALVSFVYNLGSTNFARSTLLKKINHDPDDPAIRKEFQKWIYSKGTPLPGLVARRQDESNLYFSQYETTTPPKHHSGR